MRIDAKSVVLGVLIGLVVGLIIPINLLSLFSQSSYRKITLAEGQVATVEFDQNTYGFTKEGDFIYVVSGTLKQTTLSATEGSVYKVFGIEIVVSEVHVDYVVLLVKPTYQ